MSGKDQQGVNNMVTLPAQEETTSGVEGRLDDHIDAQNELVSRDDLAETQKLRV